MSAKLKSKETKRPLSKAPPGALAKKTKVSPHGFPLLPHDSKVGGLQVHTPSYDIKDIQAGYSISSKPVMHYSSGSRGDSLKVQFYVPFCPMGIGNTAYNTLGSFLPQAALSTGGAISNYQMEVIAWNPVRSVGGARTLASYFLYDVFSDNYMLPLHALGFTRYKFTKDHVVLGWETQSNTASSVRYNIAVASDYAHPAVGLGAIYNVNTITESTLRTGPNCVSFPGWLPWQATFPVSTTDTYYTYCVSRAAGSVNSADRLAFPLSMAAVSNSSGVQRFDGTLWIGGEIELFDPTPIARAYSTPVLLALNSQHKIDCNVIVDAVKSETKRLVDEERKESREASRESKEREKEDSEDDGDLVPSSSKLPLTSPLRDVSAARLRR